MNTSSSTNSSLPTSTAKSETIIFGVAPGPYGDLVKYAIQPELEKKGYKVEYRQFSDYVQPNLALANGEINVNVFQHSRYLKKFCEDKNLDLSEVIKIPTAMLGIYSKKVSAKNIEELKKELKKGDTVTIANDPTNLARALIFLRDLGLITIKGEIDPTTASEKDIDQNPYGLVIQPVEAAQLPRTLDSVTISVVNGNYAISAGIPLSTAIAKEKLVEDTVNLIAVRTEDLDKQFVKDIKEIVESEFFRDQVESDKYEFREFQRPEWYVKKWNIQNQF
ncbi:MetQ/NlpA family ABC transporter substrate-binding protein [Acetivibrio clariflavus]|uniref:MetQ/NlpA family ABC transporter substrate-binding protein n=1 Tax=Acetivibrio clariflavus TaxID=288965 RepID=UPI0011992DF0|nr:MetQ/NlpA family ABC transporter substrate-binding protein [Acetivibrio clariflavus]HOQ01544.1 MetQ/NlpA family ABC transporter substrate-binding protein [Acetivibrio clariflavus]